MTVPVHLMIKIPLGTRLSRIDKLDGGVWRVWVAADRMFRFGTFYLLHPGGLVQRVTVHEDGGETVLTIV